MHLQIILEHLFILVYLNFDHYESFCEFNGYHNLGSKSMRKQQERKEKNSITSFNDIFSFIQIYASISQFVQICLDFCLITFLLFTFKRSEHL